VVKPPFSDVWISNGDTGRWPVQSLGLLTWSKVGCGWNEFHGSLRFGSQALTDEEAQDIANSMRLALETLPRDTPLDTAVREMQKARSKRT
jgi:hypothetical protein